MQQLQPPFALEMAGLQAMPEGILIADAQGVVQTINPSACKLLGITREVTGQPFQGLPGGVNLGALSDSGGKMNWSITLGERLLELRATPIQDEGQSMGTLITIRELDKELKASDLLNIMLHDLSTPLGALLGFAELLERHSDDSLSDTQKLCIKSIQTNGERLKAALEKCKEDFGKQGSS
jgi:signal transduction histidine kinase